MSVDSKKDLLVVDFWNTSCTGCMYLVRIYLNVANIFLIIATFENTSCTGCLSIVKRICLSLIFGIHPVLGVCTW